MEFHEKRRQQFLSEQAYQMTREFFEETAAPGFLRCLSSPDLDAEDKSLNADAYADEMFTTYMLKYTAGEPIESLQSELALVVSAHEQAAKYVRVYQKSPSFPPLRFIEIDEYERILQLIGLCFLLHRRDLLPRVAAMFDPSGANSDTLYEDMLAFELEGRFELDSWYHDAPYRDLINSLYRDEDSDSIADIARYLKMWYPSLSKAPWHDTHLSVHAEGCGGYFGYWAIEAGAIAYLLELDDSSFREHLVYPKDLVDFARAMDAAAEPSSTVIEDHSGMGVEGGHACPRAGYWTTSAKQNSRRFFNVDEIMPTFEHSAYGVMIWQWSKEQ